MSKQQQNHETDIFTEIKRDMAEEKYQRIFTQHGAKLLVAAIAIIAITGAYTIKQHFAEENSKELGSKFIAAFTEAKPEKYDEIIAADQKAFSPLAAFMKSGLLNAKGERAEAAKELESLAKSTDDQAFRELAEIDRAYILIQEKGDEAEIVKILDENSSKNSVFRGTALELKGAYLLSLGKKKESKEVYTLLVQDNMVPVTIQERAKQALAVIE